MSDVLLAVHSLTGCDTSKISTKYTAINTVSKEYYHLLTEFGKSEMNNKINRNAEEYSVHCLNKSSANCVNFNHLRYAMYQKKFQMDVEKLPCTSCSIKFHI